jgi:hypothetical protein
MPANGKKGDRMRKIPVVLALLAASPAVAQEKPVQVGLWLVGNVGTDSCQAEGRFGDHMLLNISENAMGVGNFIVADDRWALKDGDVRPFSYSWDAWKTTHPGSLTAMKAPDGKHFLTMPTASGFTGEMVGAKGLWVRIPGVGFDNFFEIANTKEVIDALVACNAKR